MEPRERLILALDFSDIDLALELADRTREHVGMVKVGLPLITGSGFGAIDKLRREGHQIFLDLKFHDIPSSVETAVREAARRCARLVTVHALGGRDMVHSAVRALSDMTVIPGEPLPRVLAVTLLTHINVEQQKELGLGTDPVERVLRLATLAQDAGADGVVASPREAPAIRDACGDDILIVCPGIRPDDGQAGEQARHATAGEAIRNGADYIVVGRPVRRAKDPIQVVQALVQEIATAQG